MLWRYALPREHVHCYLDNAKLRIINGIREGNAQMVYETHSSVYEIALKECRRGDNTKLEGEIVFFRLEILATKREKLYLCIRLNNSTFGR